MHKTMKAQTYVQLFTQDACPAGWARKSTSTPLSLREFHSPAQVVVSWRGELGTPLPFWYGRAALQQVRQSLQGCPLVSQQVGQYPCRPARLGGEADVVPLGTWQASRWGPSRQPLL